MKREQIVARLRATMQRSCQAQVPWESVGEPWRIDSLGFDSLSTLDLLYDIQQAFAIEFEIEELSAVTTVGDLVTFIEGRLPK